MRKKKRNDDNADLDELIEEITVDAYGDDEQLWASPLLAGTTFSLPRSERLKTAHSHSQFAFR